MDFIYVINRRFITVHGRDLYRAVNTIIVLVDTIWRVSGSPQDLEETEPPSAMLKQICFLKAYLRERRTLYLNVCVLPPSTTPISFVPLPDG